MQDTSQPEPERKPQTRGVRRSLAYSMLDRYAGLLVNIVSTMLLARMLTPSELGVFSVAMAMLLFAATVRDMGAGTYLVQEKELTRERIQAVWAVQLGLGLTLASVVALASGPAAAFYREPALASIMWVLAFNYLVNPFGSLTYAWLMREMRYDAVAQMRFGSTLGGACLSVLLAWNGHGAISLAWGSLCTTALNAVIAQRFRPAHFPWLPSLREVRRVLGFGGQLTASSVMTTVATAAPEFLLGRLQGMAAVGYFSRANGLVMLFSRLVTDAVYPVALSMFSRQNREGTDRRAGFLRALAYLTVLSWTFCASLALLAEPTVLVLYGAQWLDSVSLVRWLALWAALLSPVPLCIAAMVGAGRSAGVLRASIFAMAVSVAATALGASLGPLSVSQALAGAASFASFGWITAARREVGLGAAPLAREALRTLATAMLAVAPTAAVLCVLVPLDWHALPLATVGWLGTVVGFILAVIATRHPISDELNSLLGMLVQRIRKS